MTRTPLAPLTPLQQLAAGRRTRRLVQLFVGLVLYGVSMAMMVRAGLGLDPWDVFHFGIAQHLPLSFGTVVIVVGALALLAWVPLRQWPGLGTIANVVVIGLATDRALALLERPDALAARVALLVGGIVLNGLAGALYIGSQFGPGPRDGLMTGLVRRTGRSVRLVRTSLELTVLAVGWAMGGVVGIGTVLYALAIGPVVQLFLPLLTVPLPHPGATPAGATEATNGSGRRGRARHHAVCEVGPGAGDLAEG
ncbi:YitT family protein [Pedococcus sp. NPDC057267]|uniref:membrane protein YczE n=1 Tax=Pedococcus sp. NPDC057267 TaxID=3346077 RepID=UPI003629C167